MSIVEHFDLIDSVLGAKTLDDVRNVCTRFCENYGFDNFIYGIRLPTSFIKPALVIISDYPEEWRSRYDSLGYIRDDPTVSHCMQYTSPVMWQHLNPMSKDNSAVYSIFSEAYDFGLINGISFPIHCTQGGTGMLSLATSTPPEKSNTQILQAMAPGHLFTSYVHEVVIKILSETKKSIKILELSPRQRECLLWSAEGKTSWEISKILGISERTVTFHINLASSKLKVVNRQQAIARAVFMGYLVPQF